MKKTLLIAFLSLGFSMSAFGKCEIYYDRTACAGEANEKESWSKCDGKKTCTKTKDVDSEKECQAEALKACKNDRFDITKSKIIKAKWNGKEIKSTDGKEDFCMSADFAKDRKVQFDKCK